MRVHYTIPGLAGAAKLPAESPAIEGPSFRARLRRLAHVIPKGWRQLLRLDRAPAYMQLGPPPRPAVLESLDPAGERLRWRATLDRHRGEQSEPARRMMALLMEHRRLEEDVMSRYLSEPGE